MLFLISIFAFKLSIRYTSIIILVTAKNLFKSLSFIYVVIITYLLILYVVLLRPLTRIDNVIFKILILEKNF